MSICDVSRFCNDRDTIVLRMFSAIGWIWLESHEYWQDSITIYKNILENTAQKLGMIVLNYELVTNTPKACTNPIQIKGNSWLFLTIRKIFSIKLGIKSHLPLLGHYFENKSSS